jgi:Protein of unknown function (DUF2726)
MTCSRVGAVSPSASCALSIVLVIVAAAFIAGPRRKKKGGAYIAAPTLLTAGELAFMHPLEAAIRPTAQVMAKVRLADIINVDPTLRGSDRFRAFNVIQAKHVDFVLCDRASSRIICVIKLNDKSHRQPKRAARDALLRKAFARAGVPFLEVTCASHYEPSNIRRQIEAVLPASP